jgi:hypothetical protein
VNTYTVRRETKIPLTVNDLFAANSANEKMSWNWSEKDTASNSEREDNIKRTANYTLRRGIKECILSTHYV